jgi:hypothetical protein
MLHPSPDSFYIGQQASQVFGIINKVKVGATEYSAFPTNGKTSTTTAQLIYNGVSYTLYKVFANSVNGTNVSFSIVY